MLYYARGCALSCAVACVLALFQFSLQAEEYPITLQSLPDNWKSLAVAEFVAAAYPLEKAKLLPDGLRKDVQQHAASLIGHYDFARVSTSDYLLLSRLVQIGWRYYDTDKQVKMIRDLSARTDEWTGRPYDEIRGKAALFVQAHQYLPAYAEAKKWLAAGHTLEDVQQSEQGVIDLKDPRAALGLKVFFGGKEIYNGFSVRWQGEIVPTEAGAYKFSVSPSNINADFANYRVQKSMKVTIGNQEVISVSADNWNIESAPIQLAAGQAVNIVVDLQLESSLAHYHHGVLHAMLFWEGPGISKSPVPKKVLRVAEGGGAGLNATYSWIDGTDQRSVTQVDDNIDLQWPYGVLVVGDKDAGQSSTAQSISRLIWKDAFDNAKLDSIESSGAIHPVIQDPDGAAAGSGVPERLEFLQLLLDRPSLLNAVPPGKMWQFYRTFHIGNVDVALDVLGAWAQRHPMPVSDIPISLQSHHFRQEIRDACRELAICFFQETPAQADVLQREFLQMSDGSCCLPVAYILGYGYQTTSRGQEWIQFLDSRLSDESTVGDQRVSWLIARAHAQEIRLGLNRPYVVLNERPDDGRPWVEQAVQSAQSSTLKVFAVQELVSRLAAIHLYDEARSVVDSSQNGLSDSDKSTLAGLRTRIGLLESRYSDQRVADAARSATSYRAGLERLRNAAVSRNDSNAATRYEQLINSVTNQ